jgi:hypothetical protein
VVGYCGHSIEPLDFTKCDHFMNVCVAVSFSTRTWLREIGKLLQNNGQLIELQQYFVKSSFASLLLH